MEEQSMGMKSIAFSAAWSSLRGAENRQELFAREEGARFEALYRRYYPPICAFLHFLVGSPESAEDLASLVFEKAWLHLDNLRTLDTAGPWLYRVARNCATDYFRRCKPALSLEQLLPALPLQAASLEDATIAREEESAILAQLGTLPVREREAIGLKFVVGMTNREIARVLQIPEGTVSSLLYRGLRRLRAVLNQEGGPHEAPR
jgi:RNA polymerase sigma-70 factor (ECF subfamily)